MENCSPIAGFDPVLVQIGPVALRWYALAYIAGLLLGWRLAVRLANTPQLWAPQGARKPASPFSSEDLDDLVFWATLGVIVGGRLGYVLFYMSETNPGWFQEDPFQAFKIWTGGMSFHGGLIGVGAALWWTARQRSIPLMRLADVTATVTPIGLFFGRIANFINGELYGRPWDGAWAMTFPCDRLALQGLVPIPRHPSQLYEAALEGAVLFAVLVFLAYRFRSLSRPGLATGVFLAGYGLARTFVENFREPDAGLESLPLGLTMGMMLSAPMILGGCFLIWRALSRPPVETPSTGTASA